MARAVPANAATFAGVELAQKAMTKMFDRDGE
jgi:solute carrier family 25 carnitine/acylcarnitine transporter 20/29